MKNILMKSGFRSQIVLNFSTFNKVIKYSCLINELQLRIFGAVHPHIENYESQHTSPFAPQEKVHMQLATAAKDKDKQNSASL